MRDLFKLFNRRYSAVNISDGNAPVDNLQYLQQINFNQRHRKKSLQANRGFRGLTVVDSFFSQRRDGKRYPKCKCFDRKSTAKF